MAASGSRLLGESCGADDVCGRLGIGGRRAAHVRVGRVADVDLVIIVGQGDLREIIVLGGEESGNHSD